MINLIHYSKDFSSRFGKSWKGSRSRAFRLTYSDRVPAFGASAKAGVDLLTQSTAMQYGKSGIRCNCVRPGLIVTPENDAYVSQDVKDILLKNIMVTRYGCPEDQKHFADAMKSMVFYLEKL